MLHSNNSLAYAIVAIVVALGASGGFLGYSWG